jgi:hypothetical protein
VKIDADTPQRRTRQIVADVFFVLWCVLWIWVAVRLYGLVLSLGGPGEALQSGGDGLAGNMTEAGDRIDGLPVIGESVRAPFDRMSDAGHAIADAGRAQQEAVGKLALFLAVAIAMIPILMLLIIWLPLRIRFVRRASTAQRFIDSADDLDLFALRALARQPMHVLARIDDDPAGAWRRKDPAVILALAGLELRDEGLRSPRPAPQVDPPPG